MSSARRSLTILRTALRHRLDLLLPPASRARLPWPSRLVLRGLALLPAPAMAPGDRLREALTELGPVFVKFGQMLSTRRDLLPADIADALAALQDRVPPFPGAEARALVAAALGQPLDAVFQSISQIPMASASVAQVHPAVLSDGSDVVVKVLRPGIEDIIAQDMVLLEQLAGMLDRLSRDVHRLHLPEVVADHHRTLVAELDLRLEADNTIALRQNFAGSELLYVPRVYRDLCHRNMLVLERIHGVPISDLETLRARGTDMKRLAERGVETFFTQVFVHNFFHADMHPGNIFVNVEDPADPSYIAVDCAIIGSLTEADQEYLARNLLAFFYQDYGAVARLHLESGWIPPDTDRAAFEQVIRELCEPLFARPLNEIYFGEFLVELFNTARQFNMEIQPQLVLLQKTLLYIEGLGRQLYPELDLWATAKPFMERWMAERNSPAHALRQIIEQAPEFLPQLPQLPRLITDSAAEIRRLRYRLDQQAETLDTLARRDRQRRWQRWAGAALLALAAVLLWRMLASALAGTTDLSTTAALLSAAIGTALLLRA